MYKMRQIFQPSDYDRQLWKQLERRTQHPEEKVVFYIATMQNYFSKFNHPPTDLERVNFIKRNLLPTFQLALSTREVSSAQTISTVGELIEICQVIEEAQASASNYVPPPINLRNPLEPELWFRRPTNQTRVAELEVTDFQPNYGNTSQPIAEECTASNEMQYRTYPTFLNTVQLTENTRYIKCWNCTKIGHRQSNCPEPRRVHCFKCGEPNVTIRSCPKCSENLRSNQK